jgi:callose synthase
VYWISWAVLGGLLFLLLVCGFFIIVNIYFAFTHPGVNCVSFCVQVFGLNPKAMVHFQLFLRLIKSIALLMVLAGLVLAIVFTNLAVTDVFASILAFVPTGWGILSVSLC